VILVVETELHEAVLLEQMRLCLPRQVMQSCWHTSNDGSDGQNVLCTCAGKCHMGTTASTVKKAHG